MSARLRKQLDSFLWAMLCLLCAFIFSIKVPPYLGVVVFVAFFTLSVALLKKIFDETRKKD
ncbi:MAG: hypothetical protein JW938_04140 [Candidatus Omnitrophica bacterium]|nr:hypothetical protein [Candidatus Omnitrophota bacterium]